MKEEDNSTEKWMLKHLKGAIDDNLKKKKPR